MSDQLLDERIEQLTNLSVKVGRALEDEKYENNVLRDQKHSLVQNYDELREEYADTLIDFYNLKPPSNANESLFR